MNWTFGRKLAAGFAAVVALAVVIAVIAVLALRSVAAATDRVVRAAVEELGDAAELQLVVEQRSGAGRGYLLTADARFLERLRERKGRAQALLDALRERSGASGRELLDRVQAAFEVHSLALDAVLAARGRSEADLAGLARTFNDDVAPKGDELRRTIEAFVARRREQVEAERLAAVESAATAQAATVATAVVCAALAALVALVLGRGLARQLAAAVQHILSSSAELQSASSQQASATREQVAAMNEIATTIRELLATSKQIADGAQRVARIADETAGGARGGAGVVARTQEAVNDMKRQMEQVVEKMLDLGRRSQQIGGVLQVVGELLEQTNILAINATIEAAGAGEAGRRFAAVADEIRKLSDRVGAAAKEVRTLVDEVRASVHSTVMATETGSKAVDAGTRRFGEVAATFQHIVGQVTTTTEAAREIELSTKQQASAVEQVNTAIANVTQATRETEASTSQTLQTSSELANLSKELSRLVRAEA